MPFSRGAPGGARFLDTSFRQRKDATFPRLPRCGPRGGKVSLILLALFFHAQQGPVGLVVCQKLVTLPGMLCLGLVGIGLIRQLLPENGILSNLKLLVGGERFQ